jgi:hypothetical protein
VGLAVRDAQNVLWHSHVLVLIPLIEKLEPTNMVIVLGLLLQLDQTEAVANSLNPYVNVI